MRGVWVVAYWDNDGLQTVIPFVSESEAADQGVGEVAFVPFGQDVNSTPADLDKWSAQERETIAQESKQKG